MIRSMVGAVLFRGVSQRNSVRVAVDALCVLLNSSAVQSNTVVAVHVGGMIGVAGEVSVRRLHGARGCGRRQGFLILVAGQTVAQYLGVTGG